MRENDIVFFNLHRRYINNIPTYGGFKGIYSLAAFINNNGYYAQSFAGQLVEGKNKIDEICSNRKTSIIGLYCDYENVTENIFLSKYIKEKYNIPVLIGGPQATALKKSFYEKSLCDVVVRYEGELTVLELLHHFLDDSVDLSMIDGISYLKNGEIIVNKDRDLIENLDALPFVTQDCYLDLKQFNNELSVMTGRGCPFNCAFCHEGQHTKKVRFRSVENVIGEIEAFLRLKSNEESVFVLFTDDTFTLNPLRVKRLCEGLKKLQKIKKFNWFCEGHIHTLFLHPEMIQYLFDAGLHRIQLGIEAGTQKVLDAYRKGSSLEEIEAVVKNITDIGIPQVYSNIILGGAFFNIEIYNADLEFAKKLIYAGKGSVEIGVVSYWPLPETSITVNPEKYGLTILDYDFYTSVGDFPQIETHLLNRFELARLMKNMDTEISLYMKNMIKNREISEDKVLSWFSEDGILKSTGKWWYCLVEMPHIFNYYQMISNKEAYSSRSLNYNNFLEFHPMRTIPIYNNLDINEDDRFSVFGIDLTEFELDVLLYSTGKLSIKSIMEKMNNKYKNESSSKVKGAVEKLEKNFLIVYSLY